MAVLEQPNSSESPSESPEAISIASQALFYIDELEKASSPESSSEKRNMALTKAIKILQYFLKYARTPADIDAIDSLLDGVERNNVDNEKMASEYKEIIESSRQESAAIRERLEKSQ